MRPGKHPCTDKINRARRAWPAQGQLSSGWRPRAALPPAGAAQSLAVGSGWAWPFGCPPWVCWNTNTRKVDERLALARPLSTVPTRFDTDRSLCRAISFSPFQKQSSKLTLVLCPAITIERLITEDSIGVPFARRVSVRGKGYSDFSLSMMPTRILRRRINLEVCATYLGLSVQNCTRSISTLRRVIARTR